MHPLGPFDGGHELAQQEMPELADFGVTQRTLQIEPSYAGRSHYSITFHGKQEMRALHAA
jgi:hypothetical protein